MQQPHHHHRPGYGGPELNPIQDAAECTPSSIFSMSNNYPPQINHSHNNHHFYQHHLFNHQQLQFPPLFHQQESQRSAPQQQLRLQQQQYPFFDVNYRLGLNRECISSDVNKEDTSFLHGNQQSVSGIRQHNSIVVPHCWHSQEDSPATKQPFWKSSQEHRPDINNSMQCNEDKDYYSCKQYLEDKYRSTYGDGLEAICNFAKVIDHQTNQTASGSALTGETMIQHNKNVGGSGGINVATASGVDRGSENSIGEEASLTEVGKRNRNKRIKENNNDRLNSWAEFIEGLVKKVMDHQECLHKSFIQVVERIDKERSERDEVWRRQQVEKYNREAIARAHAQALASNREAIIVSHIEKITGQNINLPPKKTPFLLQQEITKGSPTNKRNPVVDTNSRWPKSEVEALIQVRSGLESRFLEPGLKGPLWEEVSSLMASMGYQRSAKRCKEKWENINKYFRKTKESGKKRSLQSKTCSYFDHLDHLYSKPSLTWPPPSSSSGDIPLSSNDVIGVQSRSFIGGSEAEAEQEEENNNGDDNEEEEEEEEDDDDDKVDCDER